jgi:hypothetical protein
MTGEIARLRELLAGATARPWRWSHLLDGIEARAILDGSGYFFASSDDPQNGELIAAAVNALPALLDRLEAAEQRVAELEGAASDAEAAFRIHLDHSIGITEGTARDLDAVIPHMIRLAAVLHSEEKACD